MAELEKINHSVSEKHDNRSATAEPATQPPATRRKERPNPSTPQEDSWSPESIRVLLDVWASSDIQCMREAGKKLRTIYKGVANRLRNQGVERSWAQCRNMMLALEDLYWSIQEANQKRQGDPITCPFHEGLEKVLPFIYAWPEGHEDEPKGYEPSGAYSWNPIPARTTPWPSQVPPQEMVRKRTSISHIENRQTALKPLQEPPQAMPGTPRPFLYKAKHMRAGNTPQNPSMTLPSILNQASQNTPQSLPQGVPWTPGPPSFRPHQENIFHYPPQIITYWQIPFPYVQHQGTQDRPQEQPQEIPPTAAPLTNMDNEESCEKTPQDLAQGISSTVASVNKEEAGEKTTQDQPEKIPSTVTYLFNMDHEEQVGNTSEDPTEPIPQAEPTISSILNEETAENTPTQEPPQISYSPTSYIPNQQTLECSPPYPHLLGTSALPHPHGTEPFFCTPRIPFPTAVSEQERESSSKDIKSLQKYTK